MICSMKKLENSSSASVVVRKESGCVTFGVYPLDVAISVAVDLFKIGSVNVTVEQDNVTVVELFRK